MNTPITGGPAFPFVYHRHVGTTTELNVAEGMTLRDWFAGMALSALDPTEYTQIGVALEAYALADAMLEVRTRK